ncbi:hypothetical protein [Zhihengliuella flava]|uniref:Phage portal protein n=1 Tax=Zhihengliuella flava TaxID=1285193 RepID=A0A931DFI3_9MICC|nr:hypothetical protein [Zhihengliuella flava]MBG6085823.1 hypothetical protein [Zhihengliuella flava]
MGWIQDLFGLESPAVTESASTTSEVESLSWEVERLSERLASLQAEDVGWQRIAENYAALASRETLGSNAELCRIMSVVNPLMKRAKLIRQGYIFGQGVEVSVREIDGVDLAEIVSGFMDDESNRDAVFGPQARNRIEGNLFDDGNVFVAHYTNPLTGRVQVRPIPFPEVREIVTDPGDRYTPRFYKRTWTADGTERTAYYPALSYQPQSRVRRIDGHEVRWDAPVYHLAVNPVGEGASWGIGDGFAAIPWARAYKEFLEDWALLMKALARIAWILKDKNGKAQHMRAVAKDAADGQAGGFGYTGSGELEAPSKSGATLDAESGRPLAALVASAVGVTVTILTADPGTTGARAVAETLDQPMRLEMQARQAVHAEFYKASVGYALEQAAIAPRGPLRGRMIRDGDRLSVEFAGGERPTVDASFPDLEQVDVATLMGAVSTADELDLLPPLTKLRLVADALKLKDVADLIDEVTDNDGNFIPPSTQVGAAAGNAAANLLRQGGDPAEVL